jgi:hypothetical protein
MKKSYLFGATLLIASASFAQSTTKTYDFGALNKKVFVDNGFNDNRPTINQNDDRALTVIWSESFADTSANGAWTAEGADGGYWSIDDGTAAPNGYALSMDGDHLLWNSYDDIVDSESGFASTPVTGAFISPQIDLSLYTGALMEFELNAMFCCNDEPWSVSVSNDDGVSWGAEIPLNLGLDANDNTNDIASPIKFSFIISDYLSTTAADNDDVRLRFSWTADEANGAGQYSTHYYWTIDDLTLYELPDYDIKLAKTWLADVASQTVYEYTSFPTSQVGNLTVQSVLSNIGSNAPSNAQIEVTTFNASNTVVDAAVTGGTFTVGSLNSGENDTITFATSIDLSTYAVGDYTVRTVVKYNETDGNTANDTNIRTFKVTETSLGHVNYDISQADKSLNYPGSNRFGASFDILTETSLYGADFFLVENGGQVTTTNDQYVSVFVHNRTDDEIVAIFGYELTTADLDAWNTFNFNLPEDDNGYDFPVTLLAGKTYSITLQIEDGNTMYYAASQADEDFSSSLWSDNQGQYFWLGAEPYMLLNFDQTLTIDETDHFSTVAISQNVPNPFNGSTVINYNLAEASNVSIKLVDLTGKVVSTINEGTQAAGAHNVTIDGSELAAGTYFYTFTAGTYQVTKRMVVSK